MSDNPTAGAARPQGARTSNPDVGKAFGQTWKAIGVAITIVSVYAFIVRTLGTSQSELMQMLVRAYQSAFYPIVDFASGWLPFDLPSIAKDAVVVWSAIGASLARTFFHLFETGAGQDSPKWSRPLLSSSLDRAIFNNIFLGALCLILCVVVWPVAFILLLLKPRVCVSTGGRKYALIGDGDQIPTWGNQQHYAVKSDLRIVFALYLGIVAVCVAGLVFLNAAAVGN